MKILIPIVLLILIVSCSKDTHTSPGPEDEITEFELFVKNPNDVGAEIYVYSESAGTAEPFCHRSFGIFSCQPENIYLRAEFQNTTIEIDVNPSDWRKPTYTFYLPEIN